MWFRRRDSPGGDDEDEVSTRSVGSNLGLFFLNMVFFEPKSSAVVME